MADQVAENMKAECGYRLANAYFRLMLC